MNITGQLKDYWKQLSIKSKAIVIAVLAIVVALFCAGVSIKSYLDNQKLSPEMRLFKKDGTMFLLISKQTSENKDGIAYIKGNTAPNSRVKVGYGILGDSTTADRDGNFTLHYDDNIKKNTNIKITSETRGKSISKLITVLPKPQIQKEILRKNKQIKMYKHLSNKVDALNLYGQTYAEAKQKIFKISPEIYVTSKSNNSEIPQTTDSDEITDVNINQDDDGVSVLLSLEPGDEAKQAFADNQAELKAKKAAKKAKKAAEKAKLAQQQADEDAKQEYIKNVEAYEVRFRDYALEYLIDKNTSTIYFSTSDDSFVSQSAFTGDMDSRIEFNLDGLAMIAYHHYAGQSAVAYFNDATGNSNKAVLHDTVMARQLYFPNVDLPF